MTKPEVIVVGGGMITHDQILPSLYQMQRNDLLGDIHISARYGRTLKTLADASTLKEAFPGQWFIAHPSLDEDPDRIHPDRYKDVIRSMPPAGIVVIAIPDQVHNEVIRFALQCEQHIMCVKPLVQSYSQAVEIEKEAYDKGLVIGVEYHKRLDDRALIARRQYRQGQFGEFKIGHAEMNEPYYYRDSNFQNWFTCENSDMFTYVGCHYIDQVHFITGLKPTSVSVYGIKDTFPNGNEGYLWTDGRVIWENGACLHVTDVLGYPDEGPGGNFQGIRMYFAGDGKNGMLVHNDQCRGIEHCYVERGSEPGDTYFAEPNPDYFKYIDLGGLGLKPVGYGYRSIELIINNIRHCIGKSLEERQALLRQYDADGIMATPGNSSCNELVTEAARLSIVNEGREVEIHYGKNPGVALK
jgi:predicted dehydrogenase